MSRKFNTLAKVKRYDLEVSDWRGDFSSAFLPEKSKVLSVSLEDNEPVVWVQVPGGKINVLERHNFLVADTDYQVTIPHGSRFLGTVVNSVGTARHIWYVGLAKNS